jgi:hypothetical protein
MCILTHVPSRQELARQIIRQAKTRSPLQWPTLDLRKERPPTVLAYFNHQWPNLNFRIAFHIDGAANEHDGDVGRSGSAAEVDLLRLARRTWSASYLLVIITNAARQCLALAEASRSSLLSKSVRSSASSRSRSICGTSFTNAGLRVTESITAHKSRPGNFSIVYRIVELILRNQVGWVTIKKYLLQSFTP